MNEKIDSLKRGVLQFGAVLFASASCRAQAAESGILETIEQPGFASDQAFIERAFAMRRLALDNGDQGYGAVVVRDGRIIAQAPSRVVTAIDPSAHAEMEAIRQAARNLGSRHLSGCVLYSSTRPCPMCEAAAYWAGVERLVSGRDASDDGRPQLCG